MSIHHQSLAKQNPKNISSSLAIIVPDDVRASHDFILAKKNFEGINEIKHDIPSSEKFQISKLQYENDLTE
jgi:hypothetical protein